MAKTKTNQKRTKQRKQHDNLFLIAGILLLLAGIYLFFVPTGCWQNLWAGPAAASTPIPSAMPSSMPMASATPTVQAVVQGPASDGLVFVNMTEDAAYAGLKDGSVDIYLSSLTAQQALEAQSNPNIALYPATSEIIGLTFNPAPSANGTFNPFAMQQVRFAFNYLVDRQALVDSGYAGFGKAIATNIYEGHPSYYSVAGAIAAYNISYDKQKALAMIGGAMGVAGAVQKDGKWTYSGNPINVTVLIPDENAELKAVGEAAADAAEAAGFVANRVYEKKGDKSPADFTDPAQLKWNIATAGWVYYGASKYSVAEFPMPYARQGWYEYKDAKMDALYQRLSNYSSLKEWEQINSELATLGINDSVGIWLTAKDSVFAARTAVKGLAQDDFVGLRDPINLRGAYVQGKPVLTVAIDNSFSEGDSWNNQIIESISMMDIHNAITDPTSYTDANLDNQQYRWGHGITTAGPAGKLAVPFDASVWDAAANQWKAVGSGVNATSRITYDLSRVVGTKWHDNATISMADVLYFAASVWDMSNDPQKNRTASLNGNGYLSKVKGIRVVGSSTLEVYEDSWGISEDDFLGFEGFYQRQAPFEIEAAEDALFFNGSGKYVASIYDAPEGSNATSLALVNATQIKALLGAMDSLDYSQIAPYFTIAGTAYATRQDLAQRQALVHKWDAAYGNLIISDGPFMMTAYNPITGAITVKAFRDSSYPFRKAELPQAATAPAITTAASEEFCTKNGTALRMSYPEAVAIAQNSGCTANGTTLGTEHWCNEITGTWWIQTSLKKQGCNPTCVVVLETGQAEINWMCTGLMTG